MNLDFCSAIAADRICLAGVVGLIQPDLKRLAVHVDLRDAVNFMAREAYDEMERLQVAAKNSEQAIRTETREAMETKIAPVVESLAVRIENIADGLESD